MGKIASSADIALLITKWKGVYLALFECVFVELTDIQQTLAHRAAREPNRVQTVVPVGCDEAVLLTTLNIIPI